jgi:hypothetical protein
MASRCCTVIGGDGSIAARAKTLVIVCAGATETSAGIADRSGIGDVPIVNFADGDS